jgi:hypothetical protein
MRIFLTVRSKSGFVLHVDCKWVAIIRELALEYPDPIKRTRYQLLVRLSQSMEKAEQDT